MKTFFRDRLMLLVLLLAGFTPPAWAQCPKLIMFDGFDIRTDINVVQARYWGEAVGVDGFFVNNVMAIWQQDVGGDPNSDAWQRVRRFQALYSHYGVTDNFIKVAIYKPHDWRSAEQNAAVAEHFEHAAALARYAGLKGVALDLEPYVPTWGGDAGGAELTHAVYQEGNAIGVAMQRAYPGMTLVLIQDALHSANRHEGSRGGYGLTVPFLGGLLSVGWPHVVMATEATYGSKDIAQLTQQALTDYQKFVDQNRLAVANISVAPGLWPLGNSYHDKSGREGPAEFEQRLQAAFAVAPSYVWIYGFGSAWQTGGSYGKEPVAGDFPQYLKAIRQAREDCGRDGRSSR